MPLAKEGVLHIVGQWSHLAVADSPDVPEFVSSTDRQIETFKDFTRRMEQAGIPPEIRHLANTAATLDRPEASACTATSPIPRWAPRATGI